MSTNSICCARKFVATVLLGVFAAHGCSSDVPRVQVYPITGKVTYKGKPPAGARVVLRPIGGTAVEGLVPSGAVKVDGSFAITSFDPEDGAPEGDYAVTVEWYKYDEKIGGIGGNVIPDEYANPSTSPVKVTVQGGPTSIPPIAIN
jgi:hypothetical protein